MKVGPSTGIEQANLSNHSNAAVVKPMVVRSHCNGDGAKGWHHLA